MLAFILSLFIIYQTPDLAVRHQQLGDSSIVEQIHSNDSLSKTIKYVQIDNIFIIGNKKTKSKIILREFSVKKSEIYNATDLNEILDADRNRIMNTRLFNTVEVSTLELTEGLVDIVIKVTERWYTFPVPIFDLVDRNFNDWWQNQSGDLSRTNYGVKLYQYNFRGRNETLRLILQLGYTRKIGVSYEIPYIDKAQRHGLSLIYDFSENNNIAYRTNSHKLLILDAEEMLKSRRKIGVGYQFRNSFYTTHNIDITYNDNRINDTISFLNPEYFGAARLRQQYFRISYGLNITNRDFNAYPLKGYHASVSIGKSGVGIYNDLDLTDIRLKYARYINLNKGFYLSNYSSIYLSGPKRQPYSNFGALGYRNDFVRGYELYLIESQNFYLNRFTIKKRLLKINKRINAIPVEQFRQFPLAIYFKTYFDMGYGKNFDEYVENTRLSDHFLYGTGVGIDFVTFYDMVLRFEYSFNREKESGLFFHLKKEF